MSLNKEEEVKVVVNDQNQQEKKDDKKEEQKEEKKQEVKYKVDPAKRDLRPTTTDVTNTKGMEFVDFKLKDKLLQGIFEKGFDKPSPIQEDCIPKIIENKNVIARSKNGTGKTAAFVIPILQKINTEQMTVQSLILVPTRELALQVSAIVKELGKYLEVRSMVATGGTQVSEDIFRLNQKVHVIVGTPGRILDLANKKQIDFSQTKLLVLDEADKLLSLDFQELIEKIISFFPKDRQVMLFSATFPQSVAPFKEKYLKDCAVVNKMDELTLVGVTQYYVYLEEKQKVQCLNILFSKLQINQAIIFCNSTRRVELLAKKITELGYSCFYIHAKMNQSDRNKVFHNFRNGIGRCLVSSDLFTRGIDIQTVNVVFNFDFPNTSETYLHRIGRSGRFGHLGLAINFITEGNKETVVKIEQELNIELQPIPKEVDKSLY